MSGSGWRGMITALAPTFLQGPYAQKFLYAPGLILDAVTEFAIEGVNARYPTIGTPTALPFIGRDRGIIRGFDEPDASYASRLLRAIDDWTTAGNYQSILNQVRGYLTGYAVLARMVNTRGTWASLTSDGVFSLVRRVGNWNWRNESPEQWARSWLVLYPPSDLWVAEGTWGDGQKYGDGGTWGTTATSEQVASVQQICRTFKPGGTRLDWIIIALDPSSFDPAGAPGAPLPDGTWGWWGKDVSGVVRPSRLASARYWDGTSHTPVVPL